MSHLHLVSDNRAIAHPYSSRRERLARAASLGLVGVTGGRMMPVVTSSRPVPGSYADFAARAEMRRNPPPAVEYNSAPCDVE